MMVDIPLFTGFYTNIPTWWLASEAALGGELFTTYERLKLYGSGHLSFAKNIWVEGCTKKWWKGVATGILLVVSKKNCVLELKVVYCALFWTPDACQLELSPKPFRTHVTVGPKRFQLRHVSCFSAKNDVR